MKMVKWIGVVCVYTTTAIFLSACLCTNGATQDLCSNNGRRLYLELGARGVITAQNVTLNRKNANNPQSSQYYNATSHEQCSLELVTCPGCVISVIFHYLNLSHQCSGINIVMDSPCHCDYVWLSEPPYEEGSGMPFCGTQGSLPLDGSGAKTYRTMTRTLSIVLLYSEMHSNAFSFEYVTERNRQFLKGYPRDSSIPPLGGNISHEGILKSPFFPALYPRDLGIEYILACQPDMNVSCRVRILFHDFQIDVSSIMEFYDWNGRKLEISSGSVFRPPVILSTGPSLMIRFFANGGTSLGYKATYSFLSGNLLEKNIKPDTDCGGYVENLGGAITMMNMVSRGVKTYDCVWLIRPPKNYLHLKTHLYLKVSTFSDMAGNTELQVLRGQTSEQPLLEMLRHPVSQLLPLRKRQHIVPVDVGFYVSLRGSFGPASRLAIIYTTFSYSDCFSGPDTLCQNHRCIPSQLYCDGFDHCGDNSDEPATCLQDHKSGAPDRHWYSHTPNYYFPKMERYPDLKTATLIFVISCLGLVLLIVALIVLLYRMGSRARQQRDIHNRLQTISELLAANGLPDGSNSDEQPPDEPPVYEAPPDYDDIIKVSIDTDKAEQQKPLDTEPLGTCCDGSYSETSEGGHNGISSLEVPSISISQPSIVGCCSSRSTTSLISLGSTIQPNQQSRLTSAITNRSCQTTPIPDSPPPPYSDDASSSGLYKGNGHQQETLHASALPIGLVTCASRRNAEQLSSRGNKFRKSWHGTKNSGNLLGTAHRLSGNNNWPGLSTRRIGSSCESILYQPVPISEENSDSNLPIFPSELECPTTEDIISQCDRAINELLEVKELTMALGEPGNSFPDPSADSEATDSLLREEDVAQPLIIRLMSSFVGENSKEGDGLLGSSNPGAKSDSTHCSCEGACGCVVSESSAKKRKISPELRQVYTLPCNLPAGIEGCSSLGSTRALDIYFSEQEINNSPEDEEGMRSTENGTCSSDLLSAGNQDFV